MAAAAVLYVPRGQSVQAEEPLTSLKPPASHASHSAPSGPVYPLLQVQLICCLLPAPEYECVGHWLHVDNPVGLRDVIAPELARLHGSLA